MDCFKNILFGIQGRHMVQGERSDHRVARGQWPMEGSLGVLQARSEWRKSFPGLIEHRRVAVDQFDTAERVSLQHGFRQRARAGAEIEHPFRPSLGEGTCGSFKHLLVGRDESADAPIVGVDIDAQVAAYGMAHG